MEMFGEICINWKPNRKSIPHNTRMKENLLFMIIVLHKVSMEYSPVLGFP